MKAIVKDLTFEIRAIVEEDGEEFHGYCPDLKGLHVFGATVEETLGNITEAAVLYIESLMELGDPIPVGVIVHDINNKEETQRLRLKPEKGKTVILPIKVPVC